MAENKHQSSYAKDHIIQAAVRLLKTHAFADISISDIAKAAQVSRNSFYRNFSDKEDIFRQYIHSLLEDWNLRYKYGGYNNNIELYGSLFQHLEQHADFYSILRERGLFHLFLESFLQVFGPKSEQDNAVAYVVSFVSYGTYGWINEWMNRGMTESGEMMAFLLATQGQDNDKL